MTTRIKTKVYSELPIRIRSVAKGYWDYDEIARVTDSQVRHINMQPYDGTSYDLIESVNNPPVVRFNSGLLPDKSCMCKFAGCCMPAGKTYADVITEQTDIVFGFKGVTNDNGIISGFSETAGIDFNYLFPTLKTAKFIFKATPSDFLSNSCLLSSTAGYTILIRKDPYKYFGCYAGGWNTGKTILTAGQTYWFGVDFKNSTYRGYILADDGSYTVDNLPDFSQWSLEWTTSSDVVSNKKFEIGYNKNTPDEMFSGTIDLNNTKIWVNDELVLSYPFYGHASYPGLLYNYEDTGAACDLNAFAVTENDGSVKVLVSSDESLALENVKKVQWINQVELPQHQLYNYAETSEKIFDNFTKMGSPQVTDEGVLSNLTSSNYVKTPVYLSPGDKKWLMQVKFNCSTINAGDSQYIFCSSRYLNGPYIIISAQGIINCSLANGALIGGVNDSETMLANQDYWIRLEFDGINKYTASKSLNGVDFTIMGSFESNTLINSTDFMQLGYSSSGTYFRGSIDLAETFIEIDGQRFWQPYHVLYHGTWTAKE